MKVLKLSISLCLVYSSLSFANENNNSLDGYLSDFKQLEFGYDYEKNEAESSKLRDSWIAPLKINYSYAKSKPFDDEQINQNAAIKMDQPIFQSGGWMHTKLLLLIFLIAYSFSLNAIRKKLVVDPHYKSGKYFRVYNEIPTLLMIFIVIMVVVKPF